MSTYTDSLGLEEITPGDQAGLWGNTTNNNLALIDQAVTGVTPISFLGLSGTVKTLDAANGALDEARAAVLNITGLATGTNTVVVPNKQKTYLVRNETGQSVIFRTATPGDSYPVLSGNSILIFCDGNNNVFTGIKSPDTGTLSVTGGGTGKTTFTAGFVISPGGNADLSTQAAIGLGGAVGGTPVTNQTLGQLQVANGGTGASTFTGGSLLVGNGTANFGTLVGGGVGQVATWNGSTWTAATPATSAVASVFGRTGIVTAQASDYSAFYANTSNPTFSTSVTSPIYYVGNTNNYFTQSSNEINVITGGSPVTKFNNQGIGTLGTFLADGAAFDFQNIRSLGSGFQSGLSPTSLQLGVAGAGLIYSSIPRITIALAGTRANFDLSGNFQANNSPNWATVSDINIKTNLRPISSVLDKINALKPCHFEYKDKLGEVQTGFIAQEFATVFPGHTMDTHADDTYKDFLPEGETKLKSIDMNLTAYLVKAIQELNAKVDAQAAEITALKAK